MLTKIARLQIKANLARAKDAKRWVLSGNSIAGKDRQAAEECFPQNEDPGLFGRDIFFIEVLNEKNMVDINSQVHHQTILLVSFHSPKSLLIMQLHSLGYLLRICYTPLVVEKEFQCQLR